MALFAGLDLAGIVNMALLTMLVFAACMVASSRNLLKATVYLTIYSLIMALAYLILSAPDVAITEAAIGAGVSTLLLLATMLIVGEDIKESKSNAAIPLLIILFTGLALVMASAELPVVGDAQAVTNLHVAPYYIANTAGDMGFPNIVTAVLSSYRGFDTFGEVVVVFTAAIAILLLIGRDEDETGKR